MRQSPAYFAVNRYGIADMQVALSSRMREDAQPGHRWFVLVDSAFDEGRPPLAWKTQTVPLYGSGRLEPLGAVSPLLCELSVDDEASLRRELATLLWHVNGRPMMSFLQSPLQAKALAERLQRVLEVRTVDDQSFLLRLADTRSIAAIRQSFSTQHWATLTQAIARWLIVDRSGDLVELATANLSNPVVDAFIELQDDEFERLVALCEPDAVIDALATHFRDLLPVEGSAGLHAEVQKTCELASRCGLNAFPDLLTLAVAVRCSSGALLNQQDLAAWLSARAWPADAFEAALAERLEGIGQ